MKTTGVIRKLDELGRITLPIELRRSLNLDVKDALEITVQDDCIILKTNVPENRETTYVFIFHILIKQKQT